MTKKEILIVTLALLLSNAMAGLDGTIVNTALPSIISDLQAIEYMAWIVAVFLLTMAVSTPLWSKLGERIGNKSAYQISTFLFALGAIFQGLSGNIQVFLVARALMGLGAGGMNTIPFIIYADLYNQPSKRAKVIALATASFSTASIIGPLVGGWIVDTFSWQWVFYINVPIALLSIICVQIFFKANKKTVAHKKADIKGACVMVLGLVSLLIGVQMLGNGQMGLFMLFMLVGVILLIRLLKIEEKAQDPIIPNRLFENRALVADFLLFAIIWGAFIAFNIYLPMWAQGLLGLSALLGGITQIPGAFTNFGGSILGPMIQKHIGKYQTIALGTVSFMIAFAGMALAGIEIPFWFLLVAGIFEGFGLGLCFNILQISVQEDAEKKDIPVATSFAFLVRILSQTFLSTIYGVVLNRSLQNGVQESQGTITMDMLNQLTDSASAGSLPRDLLPQMQSILFNGLHHIMLISLALLVIALLFNIFVQMRERKAIHLEKGIKHEALR
ncbi:MFS transporter [Eubacteriaceae bacterium ES2]|nr:MFS transporter [Eubacteriaceae bacterium ES2]